MILSKSIIFLTWLIFLCILRRSGKDTIPKVLKGSRSVVFDASACKPCTHSSIVLQNFHNNPAHNPRHTWVLDYSTIHLEVSLYLRVSKIEEVISLPA